MPGKSRSHHPWSSLGNLGKPWENLGPLRLSAWTQARRQRADVPEVSQNHHDGQCNGRHSVPPCHRRRPGSNDDRALLPEALGTATGVPADTQVVRHDPAKPSTFTPDSVMEMTWPGQMTFDIDGTPSGMTAPRTYRMTAGPNGTPTRWLTLQEKSA